MFVRGKFLRGVDIHDQLRACKWRISFIVKGKGWPKLSLGLFEILLINVYIIKQQDTTFHNLPSQFRWDCIEGLVAKANQLDSLGQQRRTPAAGEQHSTPESDDTHVSRFEGVDKHHWDLLHEYVTPIQAETNTAIAAHPG